MADFRCPEMAAFDGKGFNGTRYVLFGGVGRGAVGRKRSAWTGYRLTVACALVLTIGSLLMSTVCLWNQRKLEAENSVLKEDVEVLEAKILTVEEKLSETVASGRRSKAASSSAVEQPWIAHIRRRRSNGEHHRRRKGAKAVHYRLDAEGSTTTELKWSIWNGPETTSDRVRPTSQYSLDVARLTDDRKSVIISESGLYFIYAQIHFENAKRINAFAIKVDNDTITKCFQTLDYYNNTLTSTENSRLKPCYSATTVVLRRNHVVSLVNLYSPNRIFNDPYANYWGIVKFADA